MPAGTAASFVTHARMAAHGQQTLFPQPCPPQASPKTSWQTARVSAKNCAMPCWQARRSTNTVQNMGAARVDEKLIFSEKAASRSFYLWGRLLMAAGRVSPLLRRALLAVYIVFLITLILTVIPISIVLKNCCIRCSNAALPKPNTIMPSHRANDFRSGCLKTQAA